MIVDFNCMVKVNNTFINYISKYNDVYCSFLFAIEINCIRLGNIAIVFQEKVSKQKTVVFFNDIIEAKSYFKDSTINNIDLSFLYVYIDVLEKVKYI